MCGEEHLLFSICLGPCKPAAFCSRTAVANFSLNMSHYSSAYWSPPQMHQISGVHV
uniref:Uncharacterized protein n=1 Tax=Anguilla anguilla TaxID=7936 RepID=A0A0E9V2D2_ANGAN